MRAGSIEEALRHLIEIAGPRQDWPSQRSEPSLIMGFDEALVVFRGEGLRALNRLIGLAAGHALDGGGPHPEVVKQWAAEACRASRIDLEAAVTGFLHRIDAPTRTWRVVIPAPEVTLPSGHETLRVGSCEVRTGIPPDMVFEEQRSPLEIASLTDALAGTVLVTTAQARDRESAEIVAMDRVEAARAILSAASGSSQRSYPDALLVLEDGGWATAGQDAYLLPWPALNDPSSPHVWKPGWHELSEAAGTPDVIAPWPRRVLEAARWVHRSRHSWWASERIASSFAALEALLLPEGTFRGKGKKLAAAVSLRGVLHGHDKASQERWLADLYGEQRTAAVHIGKPVGQDLAANDLESLALYVLKWGIWHLSPFHRMSQRPCAEIEEVLDPSVH